MVDPDGVRRRRKAERPAELLDAALSVFVERGYAAARLEEIAARAGVSKGTLYLYYEGKEALFKAVIEEAIVPLIAEGEALVANCDCRADEVLRDLMVGWWRAVGGTRLAGIPKLMIAEARNFPEIAQFYFDQVVVRGRQLFIRVVVRGISEGVFRPVDPELMCQVLLAPLIMGGIWRQSFSPCEPHGIDWEAYVATHVDLALNGLRPAANPDGEHA